MNQEIIEQLKIIKPIIHREFLVNKIGIFGSYSRNEEHAESDIDIIVELEKPLGLRFITLLLFLEDRLKKKVDLVTMNALKPSFKNNIINDTIYI